MKKPRLILTPKKKETLIFTPIMDKLLRPGHINPDQMALGNTNRSANVKVPAKFVSRVPSKMKYG